MNTKKRIDPDRSDTPFAVLRGEWWEDRKRELAKMNRGQLQNALEELGIPQPIEARKDDPTPPSMRWDSMLWLRLRLAGEEQIQFHLDRNEPVPDSMRHRMVLMDKAPGWVPVWSTNIFYDVDNKKGEKARITKQNNAIEAAIMADTRQETQNQ